MLKIMAYCSSGILLDYNGCSILIDGIASDYAGFTGLSSEFFEKICRRDAPFSDLRGCFFSHDHPDHFDRNRVRILEEFRPDCCFFVPGSKKTAESCIQCDPFSVLYHEIPHMPFGMPQTSHGVFLIRVGPHCVYFAADAVADPAYHAMAIGNFRPDYVFANFLHLSSVPMASFFQQLSPKRLFLIHLPEDSAARQRYRAKAERCVERLQHILPPVTLVDHYPAKLI